MTYRHRLITMLATFACLQLISPVTHAGPAGEAWFPWKKDRYWVYEGSVNYLDPASDEPVRREITWVTRVEGVITTGNWSVALVRGMPHHAAWFGEEIQAGTDLVAMDTFGRVFEIQSDNAEVTFWSLLGSDARILPASLRRPEDLAMRRGMKQGDLFGGDGETPDPRPGWHNWGVEAVGETAPESLPDAIEALVKDKVYRMGYRTSPDHSTKTFAPGVGYLEYEYQHHGTPGDCFLKLTATGDDAEGKRRAGLTKMGAAKTEDGKEIATFQLVRDFLDATSSDGSVEKLKSLLHEEVDWFGSRKRRDAIIQEELEYYQTWPLRKMTLGGNLEAQDLAGGAKLFRYTLDHHTASLGSKQRKSGKLRSEMVVARDLSGKWRVRSLRALGRVNPDAEVVMGVRVGPVTRDSTVRGLEQALGKSKVKTKTVRNELEGIDETISTVFPGSKKEMFVYWEEGRPARVVVRHEDSPWESPAGLRVGSDLLSVQYANGGGFGLFGFEWDYGGTIATWNGGKLARDHAAGHLFSGWFRYAEQTDHKDLEKLIGDAVLPSGSEEMMKLNPYLGAVEFLFPWDLMHIGGLAQGMPYMTAERLVPEKPHKGEDQFWGATGLYHQDWQYPVHGVNLSMASEEKGGFKEIDAVTVSAPCPLETQRGVRIGNTWQEVALAYADLYSEEGSEAKKTFVAGSVYGGMIFSFEGGRVTEIFLGASAE